MCINLYFLSGKLENVRKCGGCNFVKKNDEVPFLFVGTCFFSFFFFLFSFFFYLFIYLFFRAILI